MSADAEEAAEALFDGDQEVYERIASEYRETDPDALTPEDRVNIAYLEAQGIDTGYETAQREQSDNVPLRYDLGGGATGFGLAQVAEAAVPWETVADAAAQYAPEITSAAAQIQDPDAWAVGLLAALGAYGGQRAWQRRLEDE